MATFKVTVDDRDADDLVPFLEDSYHAAVEELGTQSAEDEPPAHCGDIVELRGIEYLVFAEDANGWLELRPRDELIEDHPLS